MRLIIIGLAVLALAGCGGSDPSSRPTEEQRVESNLRPNGEWMDWDRVGARVWKHAGATGKGKRITDCYRRTPNADALREASMVWHCTIVDARRVSWDWEGTVDLDGNLLSSKLEKVPPLSGAPMPLSAAEKKPREYWSAYAWCKKYGRTERGLAYEYDSLINEYGKVAGYPSPTDVEDIGCRDGYDRVAPIVPEPKGYEIPGPPVAGPTG